MTRLERDVRRLVRLDDHDYVVSLVAGKTPLIRFRRRGRRTAFDLPLEHVLYVVARKAALELVVQRRARRLKTGSLARRA